MAGASQAETETHAQGNDVRFKHDPLDYHGSAIRLVKILPCTEPDQQIQCEKSGEWILVNDHMFWARQNLFDFLNSARDLAEIHSEWIWIDAICIDQENLKEREHQVRQMGLIFSRATTVVSWLGSDLAIARFLHFTRTGTYQYPNGLDTFNQSPYWKRAWITQEIALARKILFVARNMVLNSDQLPEPTPVDYYMGALMTNWNQYLETFFYIRNLPKDTNLFQLLSKSRNKKCGQPRDRIFSLLALCCDGASVHVDYSKSNAPLAWDILNSCKYAFCLCSMYSVHHALDLKPLPFPCPHGFTPAGESRCGSVTFPILWQRTTPVLEASGDNMRPLQDEERESWRSRGKDLNFFPMTPQPVAYPARWFQPLQQYEHWLENHVVWWNLQKGSQEEPWVCICISLAAICASQKGWFKLLVNVNTGCVHYQPPAEDYHATTEGRERPYLLEEWLPKPGGHNDYEALRCCPRASTSKFGSTSQSDGIALELCSGATAPGIYGF
ncbi:heterokaryon incompatibility protein-domain-containing protein [Paraphoma chrysanthemicola]|nr:heterokaryon incompatibility protein-domain-containing protein [Paraphoma chrysanthemicola]